MMYVLNYFQILKLKGSRGGIGGKGFRLKGMRMALWDIKMLQCYLESILNLHVLKLILWLWFKGQQLLDLFQDLQTHIPELLVLLHVTEINIFLFRYYLTVLSLAGLSVVF